MSRILKVSQSDYRVRVQSGGTITLDTGTNVGIVRVTGSLVVEGDYTTVNVSDMQVEDNIILLNKGETGAGVTEGTSGIEIDRNTLPNAQFVWDETLGKFVLQNEQGTLIGIRLADITTLPNENLQFNMQNGSGVLRITNSTDYEDRVLNDDDIPNKKWVNDYVLAYDGYAVVDKIFSPVTATPGNENSLTQANPTNIRFYVRSGGSLNQRAQVTSQGLDVDNINVFTNTIKNTGVSNLILTAVSNNVEIDGVLNLDQQASDPVATSAASRVYSKTVTSNYELYISGLFVVNNRTADELVVKNRALLLSMLF